MMIKMMKKMMKRLLLFSIISSLFIGSATAGGKPGLTNKKIDYLKSAINPQVEGFFIGPIGARALMHHGDPAKNLLPQCWVNVIEEGSPADGKLLRGDIILGIDGKLFTPGDPRIEIGNRIIVAETDGKPMTFMIFRPSEEVKMLVIKARKDIIKPDQPAAVDPGLSRSDDFEIDKNVQEIAKEIQDKKDAKVASMNTALKGKRMNISFTLPVLGPYSETSPANCVRSQKIIENGLKFLARKNASNKINGRLSLGPVALLASGEKKYIALVKEYMLSQKLDQGINNIPRTMLNSHYHGWFKGYEGILLGEYYLLTGDKTFYARLRDNAIRISLGQDDNGLWGHSFIRNYIYRGRSLGRSIGYGNVNSAGLACFTALALAKKAGVDDPRVNLAIERASKYFRSYLYKGRIGYGFHGPSPGQGSNGKMGIAGAAYTILGDWEAMRYFSKCSMTYRSREAGHGGNMFNNVWGGLGSNLATTEGAASYYKTRRWYCTMVRSWDGGFYGQDGSGHGGRKFGSLVTGGYILNYLSSKRSLYITGKDVPAKEMLTKKDVEEGEYVFSFRKNHDIKTMKVSELMPILENWASGIRALVARELATRKPEDVIPGVRKYLRGDDVLAGYGAARVAIGLKEESRPLWPDLIHVLETSKDYYLVKLCAQALTPAGESAFNALMANSRKLQLPGEVTSERQQSIHLTLLSVAWGKYAYGQHALEFIRKRKVNEEEFILSTRHAIAKGYGGTYALGVSKFFSPEEMVMFFDALYFDATLDTGSWNTKPFSHNYLYKETLPFVVETALRTPVAKKGYLQKSGNYGAHAKPYLPQLRELLLRTKRYIDGDKNNPETIGKLARNEDWSAINSMIKTIINDKKPKKLINLHDLMGDLVDKKLKSHKSKEAKIKALKAILRGPYWEYLRHAIALEKLVALDKEVAFEEVVKALGPQSNFKENMAVKLAAKTYSSSRILAATKTNEGRQLAGLVIALIKSSPGKPAQIRPFLTNNDLAVRQAAYVYVGDFGRVEDASIILNEVPNMVEQEFKSAEAAIGLIHRRSPLSSGFFKRAETTARDIVKIPLIDMGKHEGHKAYVDGVLRPGFSAIRIMSLAGKTKPLLKLRADIESGKAGNSKVDIRWYTPEIDRQLAEITPLVLDIDDGLDPLGFNKIKNYQAMVMYLTWEIRTGRFPKKFVRPVLDYLLVRGKALGRHGETSYNKVKEVSAVEFQKNVNKGGIKVPTKNLLDPDDGGDFDDF